MRSSFKFALYTPLRMLKRFMPRTLFARAMTILIMPLLLVQLISAYVFFERHWDGVTRQFADALIGDVAFLLDLIEEKSIKTTTASDFALENFGIVMIRNSEKADSKVFKEVSQRADHSQERTILASILHRDFWEGYLIEALTKRIPHPFHVKVHRSNIIVRVLTQEGFFSFEVSRRRVFGGATFIFIMWSLGTTLFFLVIAALFMRNQIRPIKKLAEAAEKFGKGQTSVSFKPSGAVEVRKAALAFVTMRERILRQIRQRTEMLAGVSHDLRTPLTRIRLQLAVGGKNLIPELTKDVEEMEKMIEAYLAFAKGEQAEALQWIDLNVLLHSLLKKIMSPQTKYHFKFSKEKLESFTRPEAIQRALTNILINAEKYAKKIWIETISKNEHIEIVIDDNGPGIPEEEYYEVFRPFYRLDKSRNKDTGGVGLGLSIAKDIIRRHGGEITLSCSPFNGLRVLVSLPK